MEVDKKTKGRQRIQMKKIKNESHRYATFSKRRQGFYKKASEFSWMSDLDIGIVMTSPTDKIFSFFSKPPESITSRFFNQNQEYSERNQLIDAYTRAKVDELYQAVEEMEDHLESLNKQSKILDLSEQAFENKSCLDSPIDSLTLEDVHRYEAFLEGLQEETKSNFDAINTMATLLDQPPLPLKAMD